ncbi:MAG: SRPBCC family protein [Gammaproteobacteria bacterium]
MNAVSRPGLPGDAPAVHAVRAPLADARHLPGGIYTSAEIAAREKERLFLKRWLCVAREEEIAAPGDYLALRIAGEPIVVARESNGAVVAWVNACLHRGVEICTGSGNAKLLHCPYHAWSYDVAGRLVGAPWMQESGHDLRGCRAPQVRSATWRGWVFVNLDPAGGSFEDFIAPYERELWWYRTGECRLARKVEVEVACNWKCIAENLLDWYHASTVHAGTFGRYYTNLGGKRLPAKLLPDGGSVIEFDAGDRTIDPNLPFPKLPWLEDRGAFSAKGAFFPNVNFWSGTDSLRMWHLWPLAPDRTRAVCHILLPHAAFETPGFDAKLEQYCNYLLAVVAEDKLALESLQRGFSSAFYQPGPLAHLEVMLHHLLGAYVDAMGL